MPPPLFTDPQSPKLQTLGFKRAQKKGALVILPAHPRKPGQAWQHHSFRVSLNALSKGTAVTTTVSQVPGHKTWLPSESQHCPRLRADSTLKVGQGEGSGWAVGMEGELPKCPGQKNSKSPRREPHWMQVGLHMSYFLVISRFQQLKKQRSPFFLPDLK